MSALRSFLDALDDESRATPRQRVAVAALGTVVLVAFCMDWTPLLPVLAALGFLGLIAVSVALVVVAWVTAMARREVVLEDMSRGRG